MGSGEIVVKAAGGVVLFHSQEVHGCVDVRHVLAMKRVGPEVYLTLTSGTEKLSFFRWSDAADVASTIHREMVLDRLAGAQLGLNEMEA